MIEYDATSFIWSVFIISSCVFIILLPLAFILCTGCEVWEKRLDLDNNPESKPKGHKSNISNNSLKLFNATFRRYSLSGEPQVESGYSSDYHQFTSDNLPFYKGYYYSPEDDTLVEIEEVEKCNSNLKTEQPDLSTDGFLDVCETRSCVSKISRNSFYSTYPTDEHLHQQSSIVEMKSMEATT